MQIELLKKELEYISKRIYERGLTQARGGNISVRVPGTDNVLIKRTSVSLAEVCREDAVLVNMDGEVLGGNGIPSKEMNFHLGIMKIRPDVNAIIHAHPDYSISYANLGMELPLLTVTAKKVLDHVPVIGEALSGSAELTNNVVDIFTQYPTIKVALMEKHGIVAAGPALEEAYHIVDLTEATARQSFLSQQILLAEEILKGK